MAGNTKAEDAVAYPAAASSGAATPKTKAARAIRRKMRDFSGFSTF